MELVILVMDFNTSYVVIKLFRKKEGFYVNFISIHLMLLLNDEKDNR